MKKLVMLLCTVLTFQLSAQDIIGDWKGKISYQGMELKMVLHVTGADGEYQTTMDSPDQGAFGIALEKTSFENGSFKVQSNEIGMEYTAKLNSEEKTLDGTFNQQGIALPLVLTKVEKKKEE